MYNRCRLMLSRFQYEHIFVPVRSMQMQGVLDQDEVNFVDKQATAGPYGEGGRLIMLAWAFRQYQGRGELSEPAPIELVYYLDGARDLHNRLIGEFSKVLDLLEQRYKEHGCEPRSKKVLPFSRS